MHITIIGTGYVGLVTGACFSEFGVFSTCVDKDSAKIDSLKQGNIPFYEPGLEELVKRNLKQGRLKFTTNIAEAIEESLVIFIAVGTPPRGDGSADLSYVDDVAKEIANHINGYKVIVTKSTVPVGTGERIRKIISEQLQQTRAADTGHGLFDIVSNPEFLREGSAIEDFMRPNRVVIGAKSHQAVAIIKDLYRPLYLIETPFVVTDIETAELIKYASNSFLATKISFINELSILCEKVGADVNVVAKGMGLDGRIGPKFLHAGPGFGGSCFPKDTRALLKIAAEHDIELAIVNAAVKANERQIKWAAEKIKSAFREQQSGSPESRRLSGAESGRTEEQRGDCPRFTGEAPVFNGAGSESGLSPKRKNSITIAILGLSFKPNTDDIRESPAIAIIQNLLNDGVNIRAYDPVAMENAKKLLTETSVIPLNPPFNITFCNDAYDACNGADAVVIVTEWNQFRNIEMERVRQLLKQPYFFDLRNIYDPQKMKEMGFKYYSVGR